MNDTIVKSKSSTYLCLLADKWKGNDRIKHHHLAFPSELMDPGTEQCLMLTTKKDQNQTSSAYW